MTGLARLGLVASGGALGGGARIVLASLVPIAADRPEWSVPALLAVNLSGSLVAGWLRGVIARDRRALDAFLLVGFCGGYTSYSGFVVASVEGSAWISAATLLFCPLAALFGMRLSGGYPADPQESPVEDRTRPAQSDRR